MLNSFELAIINRLKLYFKAAQVGVFSTGADIIAMFLLAKTTLSITWQLYISSAISFTISFFGQKLWTFQNRLKGSALAKQLSLFITWEIIFIFIVTHLVIYITEPINEVLRHTPPDKIKHSKLLSVLFYIETDKETKKEHVELHTITNIAIKHIVIAIIFGLVSLPIYKYIFKI